MTAKGRRLGSGGIEQKIKGTHEHGEQCGDCGWWGVVGRGYGGDKW